MGGPGAGRDPRSRNPQQDGLQSRQGKMHSTILCVSHDHEEAGERGNTHTSKEGGRSVQTGAPEDIVLRPANGYVADFVAHLNPLSVLTATDAMTADGGPAVAERSLPPDAPLKEALPYFAASPDPVWVLEDGATVGKITSRAVYSLLARESAGVSAEAPPQ
jgi:glycine betaine/proline transport system ATP-binding protein